MPNHPATILIVDSDNPSREHLRGALEAEHFTLFEATSRVDALVCFQQQRPNLVLITLHPQNTEGYEIAKEIKANSRWSHEPILFLSAESSEEQISAALESGGDDFISTPFPRSLLLAKINTQLRIQTLNSALQDNIRQLEREIEEEKQIQQELHNITNNDPLTGLLNRQFFLIYLMQKIKESTLSKNTMSLLIVDVINFRRINTVYGHEAGDIILKEITTRLEKQINRQQVIARIGGDHFAVLCEECSGSDLTDVEQLAGNLLQALKSPYMLNDGEVMLGFNVGISLYPKHCDSAESMLRCADTALDYARQNGDNSHSFYELDMRNKTQYDHEINNSIHTALENGEYELYYQPQVDTHNLQIVGCEVLLRWHHPTLGMVPPDRFIPILEQKRLINAVGKWIIEEAIDQHLDWIKRGFPAVRIAVNFSAIQLQEDGLAEGLIDTIRKKSIAPPWFKLEITETTTIDDLEQVAKTLDKIRAAGISIAVDDFGTGYSSLNYLQRLPIDIIKIDQQFIRQIPDAKEDMALVKAVIAMAHSMGFDVVAEGVETAEQADFLCQHKCEELQGYHFSRPLPAAELEQLLEKQSNFGADSMEMF